MVVIGNTNRIAAQIRPRSVVRNQSTLARIAVALDIRQR